MSWTTPRTMASGTTGTVSDWNTYIRDNENFLYNAYPNMTMQELATTSRATGTTNVYQNTTGSMLFCKVNIRLSSTAAGSYVVLTGSTSSCTVTTDHVPAPSDAAALSYIVLEFFVRPDYYYTTSVQANSVLFKWFEYGISS